jgi:hypothetical protein
MIDPNRRKLMQWTLLSAALPGLLGVSNTALASRGPERDFDWFLGNWRVKHRRLKVRLANNNEWEEFEGSTTCQSILGGIANFNDSVSHRPGGIARGMGLRAYDAKSNTWYDWYLNGRDPTKIEVPNVGRFNGNVGTFFCDDQHEGRPVKVRGIFTSMSPTEAQWEQAFSPDAGKTWETNWVMRYTRTT